jgi:hypothetical protein
MPVAVVRSQSWTAQLGDLLVGADDVLDDVTDCPLWTRRGQGRLLRPDLSDDRLSLTEGAFEQAQRIGHVAAFASRSPISAVVPGLLASRLARSAATAASTRAAASDMPR